MGPARVRGADDTPVQHLGELALALRPLAQSRSHAQLRTHEGRRMRERLEEILARIESPLHSPRRRGP